MDFYDYSDLREACDDAYERGYKDGIQANDTGGIFMNNKESVTVYINIELSEQGKQLLDALRPKGEWIDAGQYPYDKCSLCECEVDSYQHPNFCPNCGADMRGSL